jgi:hypothetical protein
MTGVCMVRCNNDANAGPFGGCVPVQMVAGNDTAAAPAVSTPSHFVSQCTNIISRGDLSAPLLSLFKAFTVTASMTDCWHWTWSAKNELHDCKVLDIGVGPGVLAAAKYFLYIYKWR